MRRRRKRTRVHGNKARKQKTIITRTRGNKRIRLMTGKRTKNSPTNERCFITCQGPKPPGDLQRRTCTCVASVPEFCLPFTFSLIFYCFRREAKEEQRVEIDKVPMEDVGECVLCASSLPVSFLYISFSLVLAENRMKKLN